MTKIPARRRRWWTVLRLVAAFCAGAVCGALVMVPHSARRIETLELRQIRLVQELTRYRGRLERLQSARLPPLPAVITAVDLEFLWPEEPVRLQLEEEMSPLVEGIEGRPLDEVDPYLLFSIFDGRIAAVDGTSYRLTVKYLIIGEKTTIVLAVAKAAGAPTAGRKTSHLFGG